MQKLNICDPMDQLYTGFMSLRAKEKARKYGLFKVEHTGLEPVTSTLPVWRAPSCANAPLLMSLFENRSLPWEPCGFLYGPGGNRTRVRKPIPCGISHHSHFFDIPSTVRQMTGLQL